MPNAASPQILSIDLHAAAKTGLVNPASPMVRILDRIARSLVIQSPLAPALFCIGAEVSSIGEDASSAGSSRISVTGKGESFAAAVASCLGEAMAAEYSAEKPWDMIFPPEPEEEKLRGARREARARILQISPPITG